MKHLLSILALFAIIISSGAEAATPARYSTDGDLMLPENWREWVFIGSPTSPDSMNSGEAYQPGFKYVYIDPESFAHWKKTGTFRNGTMIVQERLKVSEAKRILDRLEDDPTTTPENITKQVKEAFSRKEPGK